MSEVYQKTLNVEDLTPFDRRDVREHVVEMLKKKIQEKGFAHGRPFS